MLAARARQSAQAADNRRVGEGIVRGMMFEVRTATTVTYLADPFLARTSAAADTPSGVRPHVAPSGVRPHGAPSGVHPHVAPSATARLPEVSEAIASQERAIHEDVVLAGKYRLGPSIGCGGMGTVHRATHVPLHRPVAVKLMHANDDPQLGERFLREAQVAAAARHPNVVDIIDFGTTDEGQPFMVMELLEGRSLRELMESGIELTLDEQIDVMVQVLQGLEAVHRAGIVHRDLKPANVFLTEQEDGTLRARLLDFGISFTVDRGAAVDEDPNRRIIAGTPEYMSFEQCEGRHDVDERADVHAIGVMLYELFSGGVLPFEGDNPGAVLFQVMSCRHVPLIELRPDLPELAALVERCMAPDREDRPQTARDVRKALLLAAGRPDGPSSQRSIPPARMSDSEHVVLYVEDDDVTPRPSGRSGWGLALAVAAIALLGTAFVTHVERVQDALIAHGLTLPASVGALVAAPSELPARFEPVAEPVTGEGELPMAMGSPVAAPLAPASSAPTIAAVERTELEIADAEETSRALEPARVREAARARRHRLAEEADIHTAEDRSRADETALEERTEEGSEEGSEESTEEGTEEGNEEGTEAPTEESPPGTPVIEGPAPSVVAMVRELDF